MLTVGWSYFYAWAVCFFCRLNLQDLTRKVDHCSSVPDNLRQSSVQVLISFHCETNQNFLCLDWRMEGEGNRDEFSFIWVANEERREMWQTNVSTMVTLKLCLDNNYRKEWEGSEDWSVFLPNFSYVRRIWFVQNVKEFIFLIPFTSFSSLSLFLSRWEKCNSLISLPVLSLFVSSLPFLSLCSLSFLSLSLSKYNLMLSLDGRKWREMKEEKYRDDVFCIWIPKGTKM